MWRNAWRGSAIDGAPRNSRATVSTREKEAHREECFGWLKTIALLRKVRHR
jgi:hypothetical protein